MCAGAFEDARLGLIELTENGCHRVKLFEIMKRIGRKEKKKVSRR